MLVYRNTDYISGDSVRQSRCYIGLIVTVSCGCGSWLPPKTYSELQLCTETETDTEQTLIIQIHITIGLQQTNIGRTIKLIMIESSDYIQWLQLICK